MNYLDATLFRPSGYETITVTPVDHVVQPTEDQLRAWAIAVIGDDNDEIALRLPLTRGYQVTIFNGMANGSDVVVRGSTGPGAVIGQGGWATVVCDGTGFFKVLDLPAPSPGVRGGVALPASQEGAVYRDNGTFAQAGFAVLAMADANQTPGGTITNGFVIRLTGALTANRDLVLPLTAGRSWFIQNACTGAFSVVVKGATGASTTVANGTRTVVATDGVGFYS